MFFQNNPTPQPPQSNNGGSNIPPRASSSNASTEDITRAIKDGFREIRLEMQEDRRRYSERNASTTTSSGRALKYDYSTDYSSDSGQEGFSKTSEKFKNMFTDMSSAFSLERLNKEIDLLQTSSSGVFREFGKGREMSSEIAKSVHDARFSIMEMGGGAEGAFKLFEEILERTAKTTLMAGEYLDELYALQKITGVRADEMADKFQTAGMSFYHVEKTMLNTMDYASQVGLSVQEVSSKVVANLDKLNLYNFQNGVQGLTRMAAQATMLKFDMGRVLDMADSLLSPEKAMEMAAGLQRLGVTTSALIDPLRAMDMAQNDPEALMNELKDLTKQYTYFNEETKKTEILPGAQRHIRELAEVLGIPKNELANMAIQAGTIDKKLSEIRMPSFAQKDEDKMLIANLAELDESGEYTIKYYDEKGIEQVRAVKDLSEETMKEIRKSQKMTGKSAEEIALDQLSVSKQTNLLLESMGARLPKEVAAGETVQQGAEAIGAGYRTAGETLATGIRETLKITYDDIKKYDGEIMKMISEGRKIESMDDIQSAFEVAAEKFGGNIDLGGIQDISMDDPALATKLGTIFGDKMLDVLNNFKTNFERTSNKEIERSERKEQEIPKMGVEAMQGIINSLSIENLNEKLTELQGILNKLSGLNSVNNINNEVVTEDGETNIVNNNLTIKTSPKDSVVVDDETKKAFIGTNPLGLNEKNNTEFLIQKNILDEFQESTKSLRELFKSNNMGNINEKTIDRPTLDQNITLNPDIVTRFATSLKESLEKQIKEFGTYTIPLEFKKDPTILTKLDFDTEENKKSYEDFIKSLEIQKIHLPIEITDEPKNKEDIDRLKNLIIDLSKISISPDLKLPEEQQKTLKKFFENPIDFVLNPNMDQTIKELEDLKKQLSSPATIGVNLKDGDIEKVKEDTLKELPKSQTIDLKSNVKFIHPKPEDVNKEFDLFVKELKRPEIKSPVKFTPENNDTTGEIYKNYLKTLEELEKKAKETVINPNVKVSVDETDLNKTIEKSKSTETKEVKVTSEQTTMVNMNIDKTKVDEALTELEKKETKIEVKPTLLESMKDFLKMDLPNEESLSKNSEDILKRNYEMMDAFQKIRNTKVDLGGYFKEGGLEKIEKFFLEYSYFDEKTKKTKLLPDAEKQLEELNLKLMIPRAAFDKMKDSLVETIKEKNKLGEETSSVVNFKVDDNSKDKTTEIKTEISKPTTSELNIKVDDTKVKNDSQKLLEQVDSFFNENSLKPKLEIPEQEKQKLDKLKFQVDNLKDNLQLNPNIDVKQMDEMFTSLKDKYTKLATKVEFEIDPNKVEEVKKLEEEPIHLNLSTGFKLPEIFEKIDNEFKKELPLNFQSNVGDLEKEVETTIKKLNEPLSTKIKVEDEPINSLLDKKKEFGEDIITSIKSDDSSLISSLEKKKEMEKPFSIDYEIEDKLLGLSEKKKDLSLPISTEFKLDNKSIFDTVKEKDKLKDGIFSDYKIGQESLSEIKNEKENLNKPISTSFNIDDKSIPDFIKKKEELEKPLSSEFNLEHKSIFDTVKETDKLKDGIFVDYKINQEPLINLIKKKDELKTDINSNLKISTEDFDKIEEEKNKIYEPTSFKLDDEPLTTFLDKKEKLSSDISFSFKPEKYSFSKISDEINDLSKPIHADFKFNESSLLNLELTKNKIGKSIVTDFKLDDSSLLNTEEKKKNLESTIFSNFKLNQESIDQTQDKKETLSKNIYSNFNIKEESLDELVNKTNKIPRTIFTSYQIDNKSLDETQEKQKKLEKDLPVTLKVNDESLIESEKKINNLEHKSIFDTVKERDKLKDGIFADYKIGQESLIDADKKKQHLMGDIKNDFKIEPESLEKTKKEVNELGEKTKISFDLKDNELQTLMKSPKSFGFPLDGLNLDGFNGSIEKMNSVFERQNTKIEIPKIETTEQPKVTPTDTQIGAFSNYDTLSNVSMNSETKVGGEVKIVHELNVNGKDVDKAMLQQTLNDYLKNPVFVNSINNAITQVNNGYGNKVQTNPLQSV